MNNKESFIKIKIGSLSINHALHKKVVHFTIHPPTFPKRLWRPDSNIGTVISRKSIDFGTLKVIVNLIDHVFIFKSLFANIESQTKTQWNQTSDAQVPEYLLRAYGLLMIWCGYLCCLFKGTRTVPPGGSHPFKSLHCRLKARRFEICQLDVTYEFFYK